MIKKIKLSLLAIVSTLTVWSQTTLVNYNFNSGGSYAALAPTTITNVGSSMSSTETFTTFGGVVTTAGAFTANTTAGSAVAMSNSSGTNTRYFTVSLSGSALVNYRTLKLYFQSQRSGSGATLLTVEYSRNGGAYTAFTTNTMSPGNGGFNATTITLPSAVDNPTTLDIRLSASGASGTGTLRLDNFQVQGILGAASSPTVAISAQDPNTPTAVNWGLGSTSNQFYWASVSPTGGNATLSSVTADMSGTYLAADIAANGFKLYYSADATLVPAGDVALGTAQSSGKAGATETITWSGLSQSISTGATGYIYATADVLAGATVGRTLAGSFTSNANIVFTPTVNFAAGNTYGATTDKTFASLPTTPSVFNVSCASEVKIDVNMNAPTTGSIVVFANTSGLFTDPTGAGTSFTGANSNYASAASYPAVGGKLVYSGAGANFSLTGLTAGQTYSLKAYSYSGSTWNTGTAVITGAAVTQPVTAIVASPSSGQINLSWSNPSATACYNNVIVIARQGSAVETAVSKANFDGLISDADLTGANATWTLNANSNDIYDLTSTVIGTDNTNFLVYKGTGTSVALTGLTNGTPYYFRVFTVDGTGSAARWSAAADANGTPDEPGYFWNGGSISALPANGGTGTWGTTNAWRQPGASGAQATWANNNAAIFGGTAGVITLDNDRIATSYLFNTSSYTLQTTSTTTRLLTGPITLANNNELVLSPNLPSTTDGAMSVGSISGSGTASVRIHGNPSSLAVAKVNIATSNAVVSVPTTITTASGTGFAGYVGTNTGVVISGNITNNSALTTIIGATSGNDISVNGIISGTSGLQFSAGASGGTGDIYLNTNNTYSGATQFNSLANANVILGVNNALPASGDVIMAFNSVGGSLDLNGHSQSVGNLSSNNSSSNTISNNSTTSNSTLTVNQTIAQSFGLAIKDGSTRTVTLVKNGSAVWTLTNSGHTFSGGLMLNAGELRFNPTASLTSLSLCPVSLNGGTLGSTGIASTRVVRFSTLNLSDNSTINLSTSATHTLNFAASSSVSWTASKTLLITGWQGTYNSASGSSGTAGKIFVGTSATDLTSGQLSQIKFFDGTTNFDAMLLANGELVPYLAGATTQLRTTYCGYTAQSFGEFIGADSVLTANHYRFQLVNAANSYTQTFTNSSGYPYLTLYTIPGIGYNTTYTVTVAWSADGVSWSPYGSPCSITSPAAEITQLEPGNCGYTALSYPEIIRANAVSGATQYQFKLENAALGYSQSLVKTNNNFNLSQFSGLLNASTYSVSVRVFIFGAWDIYGPVCQLTTPTGVPTTSLQASSCGVTVSSYPQILFAEPVGAATQYEYKLENAALGYSQTYVKTNNNFNMAQFTGLANATTYSVSVRVNVNNTWGSYGNVCSVTTPAGVPTTSLQPASCGVTVSSYPQILFAESVGAATQYEYKLVNTALGYSQTYVKTNNNFNLAQFTGLLNNTTYSVSVRANVGNTWGSFGTECQVTTPSSIPSTSLQPSYCGMVATAYDQIIFATNVTGATQYEYRLENAGLGYSQTYAKSNSNFNLTQFPGLVNNTTYSVSVRVNIGGSWGSFGPACTVTTPATTPTTSLQPSSCGITLSGYTQILFAVPVTGATQYEYKLENTGLGYSQSYVKSNSNFNFGQFSGLSNNTPYNVQVRVFFNGVWGNYGTMCTVTTPSSARMASARGIENANNELEEKNNFDAMAYPNPFNDQFAINLVSYNVNEAVTIRVFDATGKLMEEHHVSPESVKDLTIGSAYAQGLYNIVISQGAQSKSMKVIRS